MAEIHYAKLIKGSRWAKEQFEIGSRPSESTLMRWITEGEVCGEVIDSKPYVYADLAFKTPTKRKAANTMRGIDLLS